MGLKSQKIGLFTEHLVDDVDGNRGQKVQLGVAQNRDKP